MTKRNKLGIFVLVFTLSFLVGLLIYYICDLLSVIAFLGTAAAVALLIIGYIWATD